MTFIPQITFNTTQKIKNDNKINNNYNANYDVFKDTSKRNKLENVLLGSLISLATLGVGAVHIANKTDNQMYQDDYYVGVTDKYKDIICDPVGLAKGGEYDSIVEMSEFMNYLYFDNMKCLPKYIQESIKTRAYTSLTPVNINHGDAKTKILDQITRTQQIIDNYVNDARARVINEYINPEKPIEAKFITPQEILNSVDFSSVAGLDDGAKKILLARVINSLPKIEKDWDDTSDKFMKAVKNAQELINQVAKEEELKTYIVGNDDADNVLSPNELFNLLNQDCLNGLSEIDKKRAIKNTISTCKSLVFDDLKNESKEEIREKITKAIQKAQNVLDIEALKYQNQIFDLALND